jgi:hypothetical protein
MLEAPGVNWKSAIPEMRVMNMWEWNACNEHVGM